MVAQSGTQCLLGGPCQKYRLVWQPSQTVRQDKIEKNETYCALGAAPRTHCK